MLEYLRKLFAYNDWANREVLPVLKSCSSPPRSVKLLAHILSAERLWFERLTSKPQSFPVWPELTLPECEVLISEVAEHWKEYFLHMAEGGLERTIHYKNSHGDSFDSRVEDVLTHVVMHGVYHRGQIAADLRTSGITPPYTDFIHAVRHSLVE